MMASRRATSRLKLRFAGAKFIGDLELEITVAVQPSADRSLREAVQAVAQADLILVFLGAENIPGEVQDWFERWLSQREPMEGALVVGRTSVPTKGGGAVDAYLRLAAERAHLDYLPLLGPSPVVRWEDKMREDGDDPAGSDRRPITHTIRQVGELTNNRK
jgi:hypothetical protein